MLTDRCISQGLLKLTGKRTGFLVTNVWTAATLCCSLRPASSRPSWLSPLTCSAPSCPETPPWSWSYRWVCCLASGSCVSRNVFFISVFVIWQKGNIYLLDYEVLDRVPANVINGKQTYLSAPLCLLHLNQQGQLRPIAIQVSFCFRSIKLYCYFDSKLTFKMVCL